MMGEACESRGHDGPVLLPIASTIVDAIPRLRLRRAPAWPGRIAPGGRGGGPLPPPADAAGWFEKWALNYANIIVPVELYAAAAPPLHAPHLESLVIRPPGLDLPLHLAVRFGAQRPSAG